MKNKDKKALFDKDIKELHVMLVESKNALRAMMLDNEQRKLKNTSSLSEKRKEIARILTSMKQKEVIK